MGKVVPVEIRFWAKVDMRGPNECWPWLGGIKENGRGNFSIGHKNWQAHRMMWTLIKGPIPDGMLVCHHCDNGKCVNPDHLFLGTYQDNSDDMMRKGRKRTLRGDDDPKSILTSDQVEEIRAKYVPRIYSQFKLAKEYGVSRSNIENILHGLIWKHLL
jgi:hypothetical protein